MENPNNIGFRKYKDKPKPNKKYLEIDIKFFVGKFIKIGFPLVARPHLNEYMWVKVITYDNDILYGRLMNEPIGDVGYEYGDEINFKRDQIINVYQEGLN